MITVRYNYYYCYYYLIVVLLRQQTIWKNNELFSSTLLTPNKQIRSHNAVRTVQKVLSLLFVKRGERTHHIGETQDTGATVGILRVNPAVCCAALMRVPAATVRTSIRDPGRGCVPRYASRYIRYGMPYRAHCSRSLQYRKPYRHGPQVGSVLHTWLYVYCVCAYAGILNTVYCIRAYAVFVQSIKCIRRARPPKTQDARQQEQGKN
jgi:hypothetical protein